MDGVDQLDVRDAPGGAVIAVKAVPGSSRERVVGVLGDALKIAVAAPAEKGKANAALAAVLAGALGVRKSAVTLASGPTAPRKDFHLAGMTARQVRAALRQI